LKLLVITHSYYPAFRNGGPIFSIHILNKRLASYGIDVSVFTTNAGIENNIDVPLNSWTDVDGVRVKYFAYYGTELYNISPSMTYELYKIIKSYDLIYITPVWNFPNLIGAAASCIFKKPYIISPRGTLYKETVEMKSTLLKKIYYELVVKYMLRNARNIHFTTEDEKVKVSDYIALNTDSFVMSNGIDLSSYKVLPEKGYFKNRHEQLKGKRFILFLGRINRKKGLDILTYAFKNLAKRYQDLYLIIAGFDNEKYLQYIKDLVAKNDLTDRVIFCGPLIDNDKLEAFVDADLFVLPSYSENFGMAVVEAMACGCPVVISDNVGISDQVKDLNAGVVVQSNIESLFKGVAKLLDNQQMAKSFSIEAKKYVEDNFDVNVIATNMLSKFEETLNSSN